jgi:hypothetical protein
MGMASQFDGADESRPVTVKEGVGCFLWTVNYCAINGAMVASQGVNCADRQIGRRSCLQAAEADVGADTTLILVGSCFGLLWVHLPKYLSRRKGVDVRRVRQYLT